MLKDLLYLLKKIFLSEKYSLKKRIERSLSKPLEPELDLIEQFCDKTKSSIDIGVFRGVYSYKLSEVSDKVYGFEANPIMFKYLLKNLTKLKKNIILHNTALSDSEGYTKLKIPIREKSILKSNFENYYEGGLATIESSNNLNNKNFDTLDVKKKRLDSFDFKEKISFIKIDVEGHEYSVLKGSEKILKKDKPILLIEIDKQHSAKVKETFIYLKELLYEPFYYNGKNLIKIFDYEENIRKDFRNFIFKYKKF
jgi:FkbM family methyltransferase